MMKTVFCFSGIGTITCNLDVTNLMTTNVWKRCAKHLSDVFQMSEECLLNERSATTDALLITIIGASQMELWGIIGVRPDVVIGHSIGEVLAAYAAGYY